MASSLWPFESASAHESVSEIIRQRSTNHADVREVALTGLDLSFARQVLDIGCGFGFMAEVLARRVAPDARLTGVDVWPSNETPYRQRVTGTGRRASFVLAKVGSELPFPNAAYDLVVCSYSLYFFVEALPEMARVLAPHGLFLTVAHSERSFLGLLRAAGLGEDGSRLLALSRNFSAENGQARLSQWFGEVNRIDYRNSLHFRAEHADQLLAYLKFKLPLLLPGAAAGSEVPEPLARSVRTTLAKEGEVVVEKTDAAFHCWSPKWP